MRSTALARLALGAILAGLLAGWMWLVLAGMVLAAVAIRPSGY